MTTSTQQHGTPEGPGGWVFRTNLRGAAGRLARRPVTAKSHQFGLFWRVFAVNGVILLIAFALLVLTPITVYIDNVRFDTVPEPGSLLGLASAGVLLLMRRRRWA